MTAYRRTAAGLLVLANFVCPLLFFTDLTRNPYLTQIALLNILLLAAGALLAVGWAAGGEWRAPRTALDAPWAAWLAVCALAWAVSWLGHRAFFRPAIESEGARAFQFLIANAWLPFYLAVAVPADTEEEPRGALPWAAFTLLWGGGWYVFSLTRGPAASSALWDHVWDPVGGLLWGIGALAALLLARRGRLLDFWHLALSVGLLASGYAVMQYLNLDWVWPKVLNPYGGRSVSTFGNPNFMSSYMVMLAPLAAALAIRARAWSDRAFYFCCFWAATAALLCSLTRSSWIGAAAGLGTLALWGELRAEARREWRAALLLAGPALLMVLFWPTSTVEGYTPSVLGRITEIAWIWKKAPASGAALPNAALLGPEGAVVYAPWRQRLLIWACCWQMGLENPLTGKGWGLLELFYPFYQGPLLLAVEGFRMLRTHANNAHNEVLEVFAQTGLLGLGASAWMWAAFAAAFRRRPRGPGEWARWAAFAGVAGMLVDNLLNVSLHFAVPAFLFWWQTGTAVSPPEGEPRRWRSWRPPGAASWALAAVLVAAAAWQSLGWGRQWLREADYFSGFKRIRQGQVADAVRVLEAAHRAHPREVNTNYELGNAYARAQDFAKAVWAYDEALKSNCGYDEIFYNKASVLAGHLGRPEEALDHYRMAAFINPLSKDAVAGLVNLYLKDPARHHARAAALLERAVRAFPTEVNFLNNLGYFHVQARDYARALPWFRRAVLADPDFAVSKANFRHALRQAGRDSDPLLEALARLDALDERVKRNDFGAQSLELARRAAADFPDSLKARLYLANLLLLSGRLAEAEPEFRWVLAREPGHLPAHKNLAVLYERAGRVEAAVGEYRAALAAAPGDAEAQAALGRLLKQ